MLLAVGACSSFGSSEPHESPPPDAAAPIDASRDVTEIEGSTLPADAGTDAWALQVKCVAGGLSLADVRCTCPAGYTCNVACPSDAGTCAVTCEENSACNVTCNTGDTVDCKAGATCKASGCPCGSLLNGGTCK